MSEVGLNAVPSWNPLADPPLIYELLGVRVHALTIGDLNSAIAAAVAGDRRIIIAHLNQHGTVLYHQSPKMRAFFGHTDLVHIDGMALVIWGRILGYPLRRDQRVTYVDWMGPLMAEAHRQRWRIYYLGSKPGVAERGAAVLRAQYPGLEIVTRNGYFDAAPGSRDSRQILAELEAYRPHVLMVGMSMPRQEYWIHDHLGQICANAILPCGAAIDYVAGEIPTPPRWMGRIGLEWLYRLLSEPTRLGHRYLVEPWSLSGLLVRDLWRMMKRRRL